MKTKMTVGQMIWVGVIAVTVVMFIIVSLSLRQAYLIHADNERIIDLDISRMQGTNNLENSIKNSTSALRGWLLYKEDSFKAERGKSVRKSESDLSSLLSEENIIQDLALYKNCRK